MAKPQIFSVPAGNIRRTVVVYEAKPSRASPLPPAVPYRERVDYTVALIRDINEWAELFLTWTKKLMTDHEKEGSRNRYELKP